MWAEVTLQLYIRFNIEETELISITLSATLQEIH
jgi:hypothetical protein